MAVALRSCAVHMFRTLKLNHSVVFPTLVVTRQQSSRVVAHLPAGGVVSPQTCLSRPPWPELQQPVHPEEQRRRHAALVLEVNGLLSGRRHDRLFAVVQFSGRQWKVTGEDMILVENHLDEEARCGDRIRLEKVLMVGGEDFTLIGRPLLGLDLVRVEATVVEKTESWPKVLQRFRKRKRHERRTWAVQPQTVLRINSVEVSPALV